MKVLMTDPRAHDIWLVKFENKFDESICVNQVSAFDWVLGRMKKKSKATSSAAFAAAAMVVDISSSSNHFMVQFLRRPLCVRLLIHFDFLSHTFSRFYGNLNAIILLNN